MSDKPIENAGGADGPGGMDADLLKGMTFVITGSLEHFENRKQLQELIADLGGKASGSVSSKTSFLINNDTQSGSSKNKKAKETSTPDVINLGAPPPAGFEYGPGPDPDNVENDNDTL